MSVVKFQNNVIDATEMVGGYTSWNLVPNGPLIVPANQKSPSIPLNATALECYKPDRNFDLYLPNADVNYDSGEVVTLTGKNNELKDQIWLHTAHTFWT